MGAATVFLCRSGRDRVWIFRPYPSVEEREFAGPSNGTLRKSSDLRLDFGAKHITKTFECNAEMGADIYQKLAKTIKTESNGIIENPEN